MILNISQALRLVQNLNVSNVSNRFNQFLIPVSFSKTRHWMVLMIRCGPKLFCRHQNEKFDLSTRVDFW